MNEDADVARETSDGREAGDRREMRERSVRLTVPEMDCPSCTQKVDKSLQRVTGVTETVLQPTIGTATVSYDIGHATETDVVAAIERAGYEVTGEENGSDDESDDTMDIAPPSEMWTSSRALKTGVGAGFLALLRSARWIRHAEESAKFRLSI